MPPKLKSTPTADQAELRDIMRDYRLTREQLAGLVSRSIHSVDRWLLPADSAHYHAIDAGCIELLRYKVLALKKST